MILIVGATGVVGSNLAYLLKETDETVRLMTRDRNRLPPAIRDERYRIAEADFEKPETIDAAMEDVDSVFLATPGDSQLVEYHRAVVEAAKNAKVRQIVKLSIFGADSQAIFSTGRWHFEAERIVEASGIPFTHLRPHSFMQNFFSYREFIQREGAFLAPMGEGRIPLIDARDVAAVAAVALLTRGHEGMIYELTGPRAISYEEAAHIFSEVLDRPVKYIDLPLDQTRAQMLEGGWPAWMVEDVLSLYRYFREGRAERVTDTVETLLQHPPMDFRQFATDYAALFQREGCSETTKRL